MSDFESIEIAPGVYIPKGILQFQYARSSGPGGQSVNKLNTKAILSVSLEDLSYYLQAGTFQRLKLIAKNRISQDGELQISDQQSRSQHANRENCITRLSELVIKAQHVPKFRRKTKKSKASIRRRLDGKTRRSQIKNLRKKPGMDE